MLKVIIVEDEYYVRQGMIKTIPWEEFECEIIGEASNGKMGVEVIQKLKPDVVIADIEMPILNGIDMMGELRRKGCTSYFIFLTAHQKFTYVHEALKMAAIDYLLKPVNHKELEQSIRKILVRFKKYNEDKLEEFEGSYEGVTVENNNLYIKQAISYVRKNYANEISVESITQHLAISEAYFCRLFKKETGYTFGQYLANYRMHVAAGLLKNFPLKVYEVAYQVGYADTNYFSVIFKKIMGVTPKEYQDQHGSFDQ